MPFLMQVHKTNREELLDLRKKWVGVFQKSTLLQIDDLIDAVDDKWKEDTILESSSVSFLYCN